jgi:hypothetical protein
VPTRIVDDGSISTGSIPRRKSTGLAVTNMRRPERTDIIAWSALPRTPPQNRAIDRTLDTDANIAQLDLNHAGLVHHRRRRRVTGHHHRYECRAASQSRLRTCSAIDCTGQAVQERAAEIARRTLSGGDLA